MMRGKSSGRENRVHDKRSEGQPSIAARFLRNNWNSCADYALLHSTVHRFQRGAVDLLPSEKLTPRFFACW